MAFGKKSNIPPVKLPPVETEVIRNPNNRARTPGRRRGGANIQSILSAGLAGALGGKTSLGGS